MRRACAKYVRRNQMRLKAAARRSGRKSEGRGRGRERQKRLTLCFGVENKRQL